MDVEVTKAVIIHLNWKEALTLRKFLGNHSFNKYLDIMGDKEQAEDMQNIGSYIYDVLIGEEI